MAMKIAKRGGLLLQCIVTGLVYTLMGVPQMLLFFAYSPVWIATSIVFCFVMNLLGSWFASKLLNKHFIKAGMIK